MYEGLLHYFLLYLCHYSLTLVGGEWKMRDFKGYLSSLGRSGHRRKRREGQCGCMRTVWHSARTLAPLENWASTCVRCPIRVGTLAPLENCASICVMCLSCSGVAVFEILAHRRDGILFGISVCSLAKAFSAWDMILVLQQPQRLTV